MNEYKTAMSTYTPGSSVPSTTSQRTIASIVVLAIIVLVAGQIPVLGMLFYPFQLFGTFVHELSHGLVAMLTGGSFQRFAVNPDLSGVAWSAGGVRWLISSAGYIGSAVFGGLLVLLHTRGISARRVLLGLGIVLGVLCLLFVRNLFGIASGLAIAALLALAGRRLPEQWAHLGLLFLGVQLMLDGLNSLIGLIHMSAAGQALTDAGNMQRATGIPALVWSIVWMLISILILGYTLRLAARNP